MLVKRKNRVPLAKSVVNGVRVSEGRGKGELGYEGNPLLSHRHTVKILLIFNSRGRHRDGGRLSALNW